MESIVKVSVLIPNYNHALFLEQRIETVLHQSWQDFEVIILDDCSTDDSRNIIERYRGNKKVSHIIYNEVNSGSTFKQWDKGIRLCRGEFIWIAESDDWCEPSFLKEIMTGMVHNSGCVAGYCQSFCVEDDNKIRWQSSYGSLSDCMDGMVFIKKHMLTNNAIFNASMAVWKREAFLQVTEEFRKYRYCGDWLFWIEICRQGDVFISGKLLNYFRQHSGNVSEQSIISGDNFIEELNMFTDVYKKGWISNHDFFESVKSEYVQFKAVERKLDPEKRSQIKNMFFNKTGFIVRLNNYYCVFYTRYLIKKIYSKVLHGSSTSAFNK